MANLEDIIEEVLLNVEGYIGDQDIYGTLHSSITNTANTFVVDGPAFQTGSGFATGIVEVGEELIYVQEIDSTTGTFSSVLRGWRGTTATAHGAGTRVRNNPRFPIISVKRAINDTIKAMYPRVFAVKTTELTYNGITTQYDLPSDVINVLSVYYKKPGPSKAWLPVRKWNFENRAGSNSTSGRAVNVYNGVAGYPIQITYIAEPSTLDIGEDFATVTGLPEWAREVIVFGACWRLASFIDSGRIANTTAEQALISTNKYDNASGTNLSKYFLAIYNQRLMEAEARQKAEFVPQKHQLR